MQSSSQEQPGSNDEPNASKSPTPTRVRTGCRPAPVSTAVWSASNPRTPGSISRRGTTTSGQINTVIGRSGGPPGRRNTAVPSTPAADTQPTLKAPRLSKSITPDGPFSSSSLSDDDDDDVEGSVVTSKKRTPLRKAPIPQRLSKKRPAPSSKVATPQLPSSSEPESPGKVMENLRAQIVSLIHASTSPDLIVL